MSWALVIALLFILPYCPLEASHDECSEVLRCKSHAPAVRFPFRLRGRHPSHCGYPMFELYCSAKNETMVQLPSSGGFKVVRVDYKSYFLDVTDPGGCAPRRVLQPLNFSSSPFYMFKPEVTNTSSRKVHFVKVDLVFLNCSGNRYTDRYPYSLLYKADCLGMPGYEIYATLADHSITSFSLAVTSCTKIQTVPQVLMRGKVLNYFVHDDDYVLRFSWSLPLCRSCEDMGMRCRLKNRSTPPFAECFKHTKQRDIFAKGLTLGPFLLVLATVVIIKCHHAHTFDEAEREYQIRINKFLHDYQMMKPTRYLYDDLKKMTNQFQDKLGEGGYGSVYKGLIGKEIQVAVKILNDFKGKGEDFTNEVGTIGRIHHVNVVRLVGFCAEGFKRALVYEFMPNESLEKYIFSTGNVIPPLGWEKRLEIVMGIANGIEYLHQGCDQRILHFDIKPHNILLDQDLRPKISDFGLAKLSCKGESVVSMTAARGTIGYIAPEVFSRNFGNVSYKSDVYSFGMLVLEMVGGRKNKDITAVNSSQVYFPEWAYKHLNQDEHLGIQVDMDEGMNIAKKLTIVALWCIQWYPTNRPSMTDVIHMLEGETENLVMPSNPFTSTDQAESNSAKIEKPSHDLLDIIPEIDESE